MERGIRVTHGRPYHPQTQGKEERFHRTLKAEVLQGREFRNLATCQKYFDEWRDVYNTIRPHEALELDVPASRYRVSRRAFLEHPLAWDYGYGAEVRKVDCIGKISFRGRSYRVGRAFAGRRVGLKPLDREGVWSVHFFNTKIHQIDLRENGM